MAVLDPGTDSKRVRLSQIPRNMIGVYSLTTLPTAI
jgi:hypothetical protein